MTILRPLALFLCVTPATAGFAADNMVRNPGFEQGKDQPAEWYLGMEGAGAGSARWVEDNPHSGKRYVRLELEEAGDYWMARQTYPKGSAKPGRLYRIKGWYRATKDVCIPCVYFRDRNDRFGGAWGGKLPPSEEWRAFDIVLRSRGGCDHFELQLRAQGQKGVCWFDDVAIEEADGAPEKCKALVAPLLKIAGKHPDCFWAVVSNNGSAEFLRDGTNTITIRMLTGEPTEIAFLELAMPAPDT